MALAGGTGIAQADDGTTTDPSAGSTQSRDDSASSPGSGNHDSAPGNENDSPVGDAGDADEPGDSELDAPETESGDARTTTTRKSSSHRESPDADITTRSLTTPKLSRSLDDEFTAAEREATTDPAATPGGNAVTIPKTLPDEPDPAPVIAVPTVTSVPTVTEVATAAPSDSAGGGSQAPAQTPAPWVALAAARRELGVAASASIAPPLLQTPNPVTGTVAGAMPTIDPDGKKLTYKVVALPTEGTLAFNTKTATFTYTPTTVQRVLAGLTPAVDTVSFNVTAANGTTTVPLTVTLTVAPVTVTELGQVNGAHGSLGVAVTNTRAYIAGVEGVTVIDTVKQTVIGSISIAGTSHVAVKPDGTRLYVTNNQAGTLTVVNTATLTVVGTPIKVGNGPVVAAVSPDGKTVYVTNSVDGTVSKISTSTNKVTGTVKNVGAGAALISVSPNSTRIYVSNPETGAVSWFTSTSTSATAIAGLSNFQPSGLAVSPDSKTLYISGAGGAIAMVDTAKNTVKGTFTIDGAVAAITVSKDGSLLLADNGSGNLMVISTVTRSLLTTVTTNSGATTKAFIALSPDGTQLYVTDATALRIISLVPPNSAPTVTTTVNVPSTTGVVTGKVTATDADNTALKLSASVPPKGKVVLAADGSFTYTPTAAARHAATVVGAPATARTDTFVVTIDDGWRGIVSVPVTVDILGANTGPTAKHTVGKPVTTTGAVSGTVTASDKDYDALTYSAVTSGGKGTVTISTKGVFVYTPSAAARHAAAATTAAAADKTDIVTVTISDGHGGIYTLDATVAISPKNAAPTSGGLIAGQPNSVTGEVTGSVQAVDSDNDTLSYSAPTAPKKGTVAVRPDGTFTYTPTEAALAAARATGATRATQTDTFTLTVQDGHGGTATIAVAVAIVNGAPVATAPTIGVANGATGVVSGKVTFTDPNKDKLTIGMTGALLHGAVVVKTDGTFTYTPTATARLKAAAAGATPVTDSFTITATDAYGAKTTVNLVVSVDPARHVLTGSATVGNSPAGVVVNRAGTRAYVTNFADGTLSVINTANNAAVLAPIKLGVLPDSVAVSPDGKRIFVTGVDVATNTGRVVVVDGSTNKVIGTPIAVGSSPTGIAVSPDGTRAYVTNGGDNTVTVINTATRTVTGTPIAVGNTPSGIAITPDGTRAYVTNGGDNTVTVINTATGAVTGAPIVVGAVPIGIAISSDGARAYVANTNAGTVSVIDTATNTVLGSPINVGANPQAIAVSPDGARIYVTGAAGTLTVVDTATNTPVGSPMLVGSLPYGLAIGPDGSRIYATNAAGTLSVVTLSSTKNAPVAPTTPPGTTTNANGVVTGPLGVTDTTTKTYTVTLRPTLGTVTVKTDGTFTYTPTAAAREHASTAPVTDNFTITVTNARGAATSVTRTVSIAPLATTVAPPTLGTSIPIFSNATEIHRPAYILAAPNGLRAYSINTVQTASQSYPTVTISVIDTVTNTVVGQPIYVGDQISGAVLTPNGQQLYVLRKNTGTAWIIDTTANNTVVAELAVGQSPSELIASPDGKRVYVLSTGAGGSTQNVVVIDTASKAVAGSPIVLGADDYSQKPLAISADSSRLAVQGVSGVDIIDTDWRTVTRRVTLAAPERATFSPDGSTLYVVSETNKILAVDTATGTVSTRINLTDQGFRDIALSPDGTRLYTATTDSKLSTFDAATGVLISAVSLGNLAQDVAVSPDGKWVYALTFFVDYTGITSSLHTLDTTSGLRTGTALSVGTLATNITISPDGKRVYVPSGADSRTYVINTGRPTLQT